MLYSKLCIPQTFGSRFCLLRFNCIKQPVSRMMSSAPEVLLEEFGDKGVVTLNRPKALNALNLNMIRLMYPKLQEWEKSKSLVIIKGAGEKSFCAGGDVVSITDAGSKGEFALSREFFKEEYQLNHLIGTYHIPYIALIDGITMGGGVGLSVHGSFRVATEKTLFAMPETAIGLFADVGGGYFLPRLGGRLGLFLSLTGFRLKSRDNVKAGIATHFCDSNQIDKLQESLLSLSTTYPEDVRKVIEDISSASTIDKDKEFSLKNYVGIIDDCFKPDSVEEILENLKKEGSEWSLKQVSLMEKFSPISLKITVELLKRGEHLTLADCLQTEYRLAQRCCEDNDFYEGVRAVLKDKDNSPKWKPSTLKDVTDDVIQRYFSPLANGQDISL